VVILEAELSKEEWVALDLFGDSTDEIPGMLEAVCWKGEFVEN
jgi:hypothetical protein